MFTANLVFVNLHFYSFLKELSPYSSACPLYRCVAICAGGAALMVWGERGEEVLRGWKKAG